MKKNKAMDGKTLKTMQASMEGSLRDTNHEPNYEKLKKRSHEMDSLMIPKGAVK